MVVATAPALARRGRTAGRLGVGLSTVSVIVAQPTRVEFLTTVGVSPGDPPYTA